MIATAFWTVAAGMGELRTEHLAEPGTEEILVRALYSAISRGTEALVFDGRVPENQHDAMRAPFQAGAFPFPVKYGYASVGETPVGEIVFCLYPHQDAYIVPQAACLPVPPGVPPRRAALAANMETALNGIWDAGLQPGDRVTVIGAGVVGSLVAYLAGRVPGTEVRLFDTNPGRKSLAETLGVGFGTHADSDIVIHASGNPDGAAEALRLAGPEATVLEMSWYGDRMVPLPLGEAFHSRRLTLRSSQVGQLPAHRRARWTHRRRLAKALELLGDDRLDALIDGESPFEALPETMARLADRPGALAHLVRYR